MFQEKHKQPAHMISALFWDFMQSRLIVYYRRFGTTHHSHLRESSTPKKSGTIVNRFPGVTLGLLLPSKMGTMSCPETSVRNYRSTLRKNPEDGRSYIHRGGSLEFRRANQVTSRRLIRKFTQSTQ